MRGENNNRSVSGWVKCTNEASKSPFASRNTDEGGSLVQPTLKENVKIEAVEVGSDIDQQIESKRLIGVIGRIRV